MHDPYYYGSHVGLTPSENNRVEELADNVKAWKYRPLDHRSSLHAFKWTDAMQQIMHDTVETPGGYSPEMHKWIEAVTNDLRTLQRRLGSDFHEDMAIKTLLYLQRLYEEGRGNRLQQAVSMMRTYPPRTVAETILKLMRDVDIFREFKGWKEHPAPAPPARRREHNRNPDPPVHVPGPSCTVMELGTEYRMLGLRQKQIYSGRRAI
ncbi:hypothetical protein JCM10908_002704 [Rhodotorula pacifica]|uniref:uncharacterized protein n=1 Tax=Rhodotorula pacifica TaxID=1495444 RepID=UPI00317BAAAA